MESSLSDGTRWATICERAASDEALFAQFKRHADVQWVLEHVTPEQGQIYYNIIHDFFPQLLGSFDLFRLNDTMGEPVTHEFAAPAGILSPTTMRYAKVVGEIEQLFGSLNGREIVEIGGGYGGQCFLLCNYFKPKSYTIFDLPPVLQLQKKYLTRLGVKGVEFRTMEDLQGLVKSDLVISNYAFSECFRPVQDLYIEKVLNGATCGYMTCSHISEKVYTRAELVRLLPAAMCMIEAPLTFKGNYIMVWKKPTLQYLEHLAS